MHTHTRSQPHNQYHLTTTNLVSLDCPTRHAGPIMLNIITYCIVNIVIGYAVHIPQQLRCITTKIVGTANSCF